MLALGHFLSCLLPQFRLWDRVSPFTGAAAAAAAAAESQGREWLAFEKKQTEQGRLFIRSKLLIAEKVGAAAACRCVREDVATAWR